MQNPLRAQLPENKKCPNFERQYKIIVMKNLNSYTIAGCIILVILSLPTSAQIQINMDVTALEMVEHLQGPGILFYDNVTFQGAGVSRGLFSNAENTLLGMESGIFLTTGTGLYIPGPNMSGATGSINGTPGHAVLNTLATGTTYDASVLEFDFIPVNDTVEFNCSFGSEEYNEHVGRS
jgi:hypothetical protein